MLRRRNVLETMRDAIHEVRSDIVFLQEVRGEPGRHRPGGSLESQFEYMAAGKWPHVAYGPNVVRDRRHHGNAILSRFPIASWENIDVSAHPVEGRGVLHAVIHLPRADRDIHLLCVHFGLFERWRRRQMEKLEARIRHSVPTGAPLVVAGDFNDWRENASTHFAHGLRLEEAFHDLHGEHARTYPARLPALKLDRVYTRGLDVVKAETLSGSPWKSLSDHVPLLLEVL